MTPHDADRRDPLRRGGVIVAGALVLALLASAVFADEPPSPACGPESVVFEELATAGWRPPAVLLPLGYDRWREDWRHRSRSDTLPVVNRRGEDGRLRCVLFPEPIGDER